eukprot:COSAG01_NODE_34934_length_539_cov_2.597727_1_plen_36_part_10
MAQAALTYNNNSTFNNSPTLQQCLDVEREARGSERA